MVGVLYIWQINYSLAAFIAGLVGGSVTGAIIGAYIHFVERPSEIAVAAIGTGAGAVGGVTWWLVAGAAISPWAAAAIGAGIIAVLLIAAKLELPI